MISEFEFATSNSGGSELFYCEEFGVRYFLLGAEPIKRNLTRTDMPLGELGSLDQVGESAFAERNEIFSEFPPVSSTEKEQFLKRVLGLDLDVEECRKTVQKYLIVEYLRHLPEIFIVYARWLIHGFSQRFIMKAPRATSSEREG
jgi:hypothetical protein